MILDVVVVGAVVVDMGVDVALVDLTETSPIMRTHLLVIMELEWDTRRTEKSSLKDAVVMVVLVVVLVEEDVEVSTMVVRLLRENDLGECMNAGVALDEG